MLGCALSIEKYGNSHQGLILSFLHVSELHSLAFEIAFMFFPLYFTLNLCFILGEWLQNNMQRKV
jgi:hypothetical protein